jgi:tRNA threonylcarbamoyl adenosine modification protein YeaZ
MILAIDTTTRLGSVAVVEGNRVLFHTTFQSERSHNSALFAPLRAALAAAPGPLAAVVTGTGPGSYTGARVGITAGLGLALARGIPLLGQNSLHGLVHADGIPVENACFLGNARRGLWYLVDIRQGTPANEPVLVPEDDILARLPAKEDEACLISLEPAPFPRPVALVRPDAARLALHWSGLFPEQLRERESHPVEPVYLQEPHITRASP